MKVINELRTITEKFNDSETVTVRSDGIWDERVWIKVRDVEVCLSASELQLAIRNATNHK